MSITNEKMDALCAQTRRRLKCMQAAYAHYMNNDPRVVGSLGMVPGYGSTSGGHSGRITDFTAMQGIRLASVPPAQAEALRWIDCAWRVFTRVTLPYLGGCTIRERRRRATISFVLYHHAILGYSLRKVARIEMPHRGSVSYSQLLRYWDRAVHAVTMEALRMGLL